MKLSEAIREWKSNITTHMEVEYALTLRADINAFSDAVQALEMENEKLRDLVSVVYGYYASGTINPCDICDSIGCQYVGEAESGCRYHNHFDRAEAAEDEILKRMRELRIEVDE